MCYQQTSIVSSWQQVDKKWQLTRALGRLQSATGELTTHSQQIHVQSNSRTVWVQIYLGISMFTSCMTLQNAVVVKLRSVTSDAGPSACEVLACHTVPCDHVEPESTSTFKVWYKRRVWTQWHRVAVSRCRGVTVSQCSGGKVSWCNDVTAFKMRKKCDTKFWKYYEKKF